MEEEFSFPRGGSERPSETSEQTSSTIKKNKAKDSASSSTNATNSRKRSNSADFLFGSKDEKKKRVKTSGKQASSSSDNNSKQVAASSSALPLGGGGVLQPVQTSSSKKPAFIESLSFQKLAKGTKLLGIVREVAEDYAVVSLPSMLTGFIRPDAKSGIPLHRVVSVGQFLAVVVVKATSETVKTKDGNKPQMKRRIEVSVSPSLMNNGITMDMLHEHMVIRGKIRSIEDHGCIVDLQVSGLGGTSCFLKYENIHGAYKIMHNDNDNEEEEDTEQDVDANFILNQGRIYDFTIKSLPGKSKTEAINIIQVELESVKKRRERTVDPAIHLSCGHTIRTLTPGMLLDVDVEHFARNGLCVSLLGNVYRGSIDSGHLGGYLPEHDKIKDVVNKSDLMDMWWKKVFVGKNRKIRARLIAVDPATKIIRLSLLPHILALERNEDELPAVGSIIQNARVVRLDAGVGALLALPDKSHDKMDVDDDSGENEGLKANAIYNAASQIRCAYVHISKAIDGDEKRTPEALFSKTFALNTTVPKLRILSKSNWFENVASCATAESIISSAVLTHSDLNPGTIYKSVPVVATLEGGGVLVQLGGMGVKGFIPATHIFDKTSSGDNSYRNKIRMEKYKVGNKVDVRCLEVKPNEKKCIVTAKKTLLTTDVDDPVIDYEHIVPGRLATGFVSSATKKGIVVTFYNNVHGRISARQLAEEMGVEDPTTDYKIGDVLKVRIVESAKSNHKDEDDSNYYVLRLSLDISGSSDNKKVRKPIERGNELHSLLSPGMVLPAKSMKIVELVPSKERDDSDGFIPGHVLVTVKAKYLSKNETFKGSITCKLPFEQIFDSYDEKLIESANSFDANAQKILVVGKKIAQEGMVLATSSAKGLPITPILSLKPSLIKVAKNQSKDTIEASRDILLPTPRTPLYMGAYVQGYCTRIDSRYGAFIRFLDNLTAIVPKLKGGLTVGLFDTVLCKIVAMDVTSGNAPKILLKRVKSTKKQVATIPTKSKNLLVEKIKPGDDLGDVKIQSINFARAAVTLMDKKFEGCAIKARVHVTMAEPVNGCSNSMPVLINSDDELPDLAEEKEKISSYHPFYSWTVGGIIKDVKCVAIDVRDGINYIELTNRTEGSGDDDIPTFVEDPRSLKVGSTVSAVITAVSKKNQGIWVQICPGCTGFIPGLELTRDVDMLNNMTRYFRIGGRIKCTVLPNQAKEGPFKKIVRLTALDTDKYAKPSRGDILIGRVNRNIKQTNAPSLMIELPGGYVGRCDITELEEVDDWENMPLGKVSNEEVEDEGNGDSNRLNEGEYCHGLYLQCRVLSTSGTGPCEVSLRASRLEGDLENDLPPEEKEIVHAFVVNTNKKGCFLRLSRNIEGRVILKELSDSFLPDPVSMFPPGRLVVGKVKKISTTKDKRKKSSNKTIVDLDLRESVILEDQNKISFEDIKEGQKYRGIVTRIESYGVFVRLDNSDVSGLVHLSECSDDYIKNLSSLYDPGDLVKVLVIKINKEDRRIGLSMKASHFEDDESEDDESDSDDESDDENAAQMANFADDSDDSDDENYASKLAQKMKEMEDEDSNDDDSVSSDDDSSSDDSESEEDDDDAAPQAMDTNVGFDWGTTTEDNDMVYDNFKEFSTDESSSDEEEDDDDSDDDDNNAKKGHKSRKKATAKKHQEKEIAKMEQRLADGTADERPETSADFERLLASDPNSSENWIKYMAFHLSLADIESARAVANRAFDKIEFRQEGEKLNVWTALLTLENKYGTPKSFNDAIARASQHNNPKQVYLRVCEMLEKDVDNSHGDSGIVSRADEMFEKMCKKFKSKKTVWIAHFKYLLKSNRHEEAHELLKRSFKSLPEYKHVEAMSKFAQLEYEYGSQERARTIFDALLDKNRKRMDLLFVYVDKEIKHGEIEIARRIFEKVINPPSSSDKKKVAFSDKQMKSLFKKWYKIEDDHGDEKSKLRVKLAAKEYVEKSSKSK